MKAKRTCLCLGHSLCQVEAIFSASTSTLALTRHPHTLSHGLAQMLVWKELNYGKMSEREKQMLVSEVNILRELRSFARILYFKLG